MTDDKPKQKKGFVLDKCRPDDLDNAPPGDSMPNYPSPNPQYAYNYETPTHKILIMQQDGHHGPDRWNLAQNDPGRPDDPQHEHDDFKRLPPTILQDADPKDSRQGFLASYRLPDSRVALEQPGDELGLSPEQRSKKRSDDLTDGL
jgi:hypothetical protein